MNPENIKLLLEQIGVRRIRVSNGNIHGTCPYGENHEKGYDASPSWGISVNLPHFHGCFACKAKGTIVDLLVDKAGYSRDRALAVSGVSPQLAQDVLLPRLVCKKINNVDKFSIEEERLYPFKRTKKVIHYMMGRGIKPEIVRSVRLLYDHNDNRILFPWRIGSKLVGVTGRSLDETNEAKMLPYFGTKKSKFMYIPSGRVDRSKPLIIVEGEIDALKVFQAGFNAAAVGFGSFTDEQQNLALNLGCKAVYVFTDNDKAGFLLEKSIKEKLNGRTILGVVPYVKGTQKGDDPAKLTCNQIRLCVKDVRFFT